MSLSKKKLHELVRFRGCIEPRAPDGGGRYCLVRITNAHYSAALVADREEEKVLAASPVVSRAFPTMRHVYSALREGRAEVICAWD